MSAITNLQDAIVLRARELISDSLALFNHRIEEFDVWLSLVGNMCQLCANQTEGESLLAANDSVYIIGPKGAKENKGAIYPYGIFCATHGMIAWHESEEAAILCAVNGEVELAPRKGIENRTNILLGSPSR